MKNNIQMIFIVLFCLNSYTSIRLLIADNSIRVSGIFLLLLYFFHDYTLQNSLYSTAYAYYIRPRVRIAVHRTRSINLRTL